MASLLNPHRPPVFCPGCSHQRSLDALDRALVEMGLKPEEVVLVSDIGCSGLFDTFFNTHAFHGLHGRALTYAAGIKLARPHLNVVVTMGDGGVGIGGAHFLEACRRNLDLTLLILAQNSFLSVLFEVKPPTGEPDAGNQPVRFGGRSGANQCAVPTPIDTDIRKCLVSNKTLLI